MIDFNYRKPTTGEQVIEAAPDGTGLFLYSDLSKKKKAAYKIIEELPRNSIILYQNPKNLNSGHWVALSKHPETKEIYFFSSYGGKPDEEKNAWLSWEGLKASNQTRNVLNDGLKTFAENGWLIHYNDTPYQQAGDGSATCGVWATAFLQSGVNPDEFAMNHESDRDYFYKYFS